MTAPSCPVGAPTCPRGILVQRLGEHSTQHEPAAWQLSLHPCAPKRGQCWLLQLPCSSSRAPVREGCSLSKC